VAITQGERITALEIQVANLVKVHEEDSKRRQELTNKLDDLLAMRNKGIGAFWLASTLLGTGIVGFIVQLISWWRHP
jgi:hypothetical protein